MQYKILLVRNRTSKTFDFKKGLEWFKAHTPLEIVHEELVTDFDVTTEKINNASYSGVICGDDIYPKLRFVIAEGKYHVVVFIPGNDLNGIRVNATKVLPLYPGTDLIQLFKINDGGKVLNHELFHTFFHRLQRQQVMGLEDPMDMVVIDGVLHPYYNNDGLDNVPSNRTIAIARLTPYWDKIANILILNKMPNVEIKRTLSDNFQTTGTLTADNKGARFICKTLELADKNNARDISCIPKGTYEVKWLFWWSKLKYAYEVQNVPNRSGIKFHSANYYFDLKGCIGLGNNLVDINSDGKLDVVNSRNTISAFENFMDRKSFTLSII